MKYNSKLSIFENTKKLFNERNALKSCCDNNEHEITDIEVNTVESVIDEYNAFIGED